MENFVNNSNKKVVKIILFDAILFSFEATL